MRKGTIFKYELRRLLFSKEYLLLLIITLAYSVSLLRSLVMFGTNYTAPFSPWTFITYISSVSPFLYILLLTLCARQFTAYERGAMAILNAVPTPVYTLRMIRYAAIACAFLFAALLPVIACFAFYRLVFAYSAVGKLALLAALLILPSSVLLFGTAMLAGNKKPALVYILLAAILIAGAFNISLPASIDVIGISAAQPLDAGAQVFALTPTFYAGRITFSAIGITIIIASLYQSHKRLS